MATLGETLVQILEAYGVEHVFGIPGVHTVELYRGLPATRLRHVTPRHEQGAGFMADGYARASGKPAVCFIVTGPGMTNILTAMGQAYGDSVPMLVISSVNRIAHLGMGQGRLHELPSQRNLVAGVAAFSHTLLDRSQLPEVLARAFAIFASARPRPVHIEIPIDVITAPGDHLATTARALPGRSAPARDAIERAAALLRQARSPFIVAGGGAVGAASDIRRLAEHLGAPTFCTINAKGILPPGHPLAVPGNLGAAPVREAFAAADVVLAIGTELGETEMYPEARPLSASGRLVRIDLDAEQLMRTLPAELPILADAALAVRALVEALRAEAGPKAASVEGAARAAALREAVRGAWWPAVATHAAVLGVVRSVVPDAVLVGDSTEPVYAANQFFEPSRTRSFFNSSTGYGTLGYALPAAIGARLAQPERPVVCLVGDGGLQFSLPELAAAVEARTPIIVLLWNNRGYGEIKAYMAERSIPQIGVDIHTPDFLPIARGFGCAAAAVGDLETLAAELRAAHVRAVPTVLELDASAGFGVGERG